MFNHTIISQAISSIPSSIPSSAAATTSAEVSMAGSYYHVDFETLPTQLPRPLINAHAFWVERNRKILLYDFKGSIYFDPSTDSIFGEQFFIRFGAMGRAGQRQDVAWINQCGVLCNISKGTQVSLKGIFTSPLLMAVHTAVSHNPIVAVHLSTHRKDGAAVAASGHGIYVCGGLTQRGKVTGACDHLQIPGNLDSAFAQPIHEEMRPRVYATAVCVNRGQLYVIGGTRSADKDRPSSNFVDILNRNKTWRVGPSLNIPRKNACAVGLCDRWIVVLGGSNKGELVESMEILDTKAETPAWHILSNIQRNRPNSTAVAVGTDIYVFGGGVVDIDKISISIPESSLPQNNLASAPSSVHDTHKVDDQADFVIDSDDKKPAAIDTQWSKAPNEAELLKLSADFLPVPPSSPEITQSFTLPERIEALEDWITKMEAEQAIFVARVEKGVEQVTCAFNTARDRKVKEIEVKSSAWLEDTQLRIEQGRKEVKQKRELSEKSSQSLSKFLSRTDLDNFDDRVPSQLRCPITLSLMVDPVVASDGITYERSSLEGWLSKENTSPLTGATLKSKSIFPNLVVRSLCEEFTKDE